jgi:hypothetical protein
MTDKILRNGRFEGLDKGLRVCNYDGLGDECLAVTDGNYKGELKETKSLKLSSVVADFRGSCKNTLSGEFL